MDGTTGRPGRDGGCSMNQEKIYLYRIMGFVEIPDGEYGSAYVSVAGALAQCDTTQEALQAAAQLMANYPACSNITIERGEWK